MFQNKAIPIIGAKNLSQINDNLVCVEFKLPDDQMQRLNKASGIELGFPHDFLSTEAVKYIVYGGVHIHRYRIIGDPAKAGFHSAIDIY